MDRSEGPENGDHTAAGGPQLCHEVPINGMYGTEQRSLFDSLAGLNSCSKKTGMIREYVNMIDNPGRLRTRCTRLSLWKDTPISEKTEDEVPGCRLAGPGHGTHSAHLSLDSRDSMRERRLS